MSESDKILVGMGLAGAALLGKEGAFEPSRAGFDASLFAAADAYDPDEGLNILSLSITVLNVFESREFRDLKGR